MNKIICPNCGAEYLPAEIYIPSSFIGKPIEIDKTPDGKIVESLGAPMDLSESYVCDYCNKKFKINADVKFHTHTSRLTKHTTKINKPNLFLNED